MLSKPDLIEPVTKRSSEPIRLKSSACKTARLDDIIWRYSEYHDYSRWRPLSGSGREVGPLLWPSEQALGRDRALTIEDLLVFDGSERARVREPGSILSAVLAFPAPVERLAAVGVTHLELRGEVTPDTLARLGDIASLRGLAVPGLRLSFEMVEALASLPALESLIIGCDGDDLDLRHLEALGHHRALGLEWSNTWSSDTRSLAALGNLASLHIRDAYLSSDQVRGLSALPALAELFINHVDEPALLGELHRLERLGLSAADLDMNAMRGLARLESLRELSLGSACFEGNAAEGLGALRRLERLNLNYAHLGSAKLAGIATLPALEALKLRAVPLTRASVARLASLGELRELSLARTNLGDEAARAAAGLPRLEHLDLAQCRISDAGLIALGDLRALERLSLTGEAIGAPIITATGLASLRRAPLRDLSLTTIKLRHSGLVQMGEIASLRRLSVHSGGVSDAGLAELARLPNLRFLALWGTPIGDDGVRHIARCAGLHGLWLSRSRMVGLPIDVRPLAALRDLRHLEIGDGFADPGQVDDLRANLL